MTQATTSSRENWEEQIRRGVLDLAILLAVAPGPRYGLQVIRHLEELTDLVVGEGTVYPILARLTRQEVLAAEWVEGEASHPRKYYRLTRAGERRLTEMLGHWREVAAKIDRLAGASGRRA